MATRIEGNYIPTLDAEPWAPAAAPVTTTLADLGDGVDTDFTHDAKEGATAEAAADPELYAEVEQRRRAGGARGGAEAQRRADAKKISAAAGAPVEQRHGFPSDASVPQYGPVPRKQTFNGVSEIDHWRAHVNGAGQRAEERAWGEVEAANGEYNRVLVDDGVPVTQAARRDLAGSQLSKLNQRTNGRAFDLIAQYHRAQAAAATKLDELAAARADYRAALKGVEIAESRVAAHEARIRREHEERRRAADEAHRDDVLKPVEIAAGGDVNGGVAYLAEKYVKARFDDDLVEVEANIAALDEQIAAETDAEVRSELVAAREKLEAAKKRIAVAANDYRQEVLRSWQALGGLAAMERENPGTTTVFTEAHEYTLKVAEASARAWTASGAYLGVLNGAPFSETRAVMDEIQADRRLVERSEPSWERRQEFLERSRANEAYVTDVESWAAGRRRDTTAFRTRLEAGVQFVAADEAMKQAAGVLGVDIDPKHVIVP